MWEFILPGLFIYGSCVSRDTYPFLDKDWTIVEYVARQGMISAASPRGVLRGESALTSKFQNQCVRNDIRSSLFATIDKAASETDLFVLDLVDERLGVYELGGGSYITQSWELGESKLLQQQDIEPRLIAFGSEEHFKLWSQSASVVIRKIKDTGRPILVLAPEWSESSDSGHADLIYRGLYAATYNKVYQRYFDHLRAEGCTVLSIGQDTVKAAAGHQWGLAPYHYVDAVYHKMRDAITAAVK
ncbi:hypothetical protein SAMN04487912_10848 [Arthrobacter sp. cf158]|uniref:DUF6270 domain-containing protein n=1 Tax=Arthrobacter sp. cf158 TaxID=1761744 RepID=UPI000898AC79|nr:DUF6270 domain-containing protein [Arthrobacter sp. cf158]SDX17839.1 hypothetical protein SAMN04487912_10848 [Arthrobacter sp. cf158]